MRLVALIDTNDARGGLVDLSLAASDVLRERWRQKAIEGWTAAHDDEHDNGDLCAAASAYALAAADLLNPHSQGDGQFDSRNPPPMFPAGWDSSWWRPTDARRMLEKAGALILAEIERLDRAAGRVNNK
jgi:hypothetical protein